MRYHDRIGVCHLFDALRICIEVDPGGTQSVNRWRSVRITRQFHLLAHVRTYGSAEMKMLRKLRLFVTDPPDRFLRPCYNRQVDTFLHLPDFPTIQLLREGSLKIGSRLGGGIFLIQRTLE